MSDRSLRGFIGLVVAGLVAVISLGAVLGSSAAADDLRDRSQTALAAAGLHDVVVDFSGREAALSGGNDVEIRLAERLVGALPGVRRVELARLGADAIDGVARFELDRAGDVVQISGVVPTPDDAAGIKVGVATSLATTIAGDVTVDRSLAAVSWTGALPDVLQALEQVDDLELDVAGDGTVVIGGTVGSRDERDERDRLVRQVSRALPDLEVVSQLQAAAPVGRRS